MARILVVDDEEAIRLGFRKMLELVGHTVGVAADAVAALASCRAARPDVVVTDVFMPDKDGLELIWELTREYPGLAIVAVTGGGRWAATSDPEAMLRAAARFGAVRVLRKPVRLEALRDAVAGALATAAGPARA